MQERAEIQNMIVLQHCSLEELKGLYGIASEEAKQDFSNPEDPPPSYDDPASDEVRLSLTAPPRPPKREDTSKAVVQYHETPLQQLDESLRHALARENSTLSAPVPDIVNHLLHEWIQPEFPEHTRSLDLRAMANTRPAYKERKYAAHISDEEEDTTESEYDESDEPSRGYYLEGPHTNGAKKNVRFKNQQAKVEDHTDEEERRPKRPSKKHIINSDDDSSDSSHFSPITSRPKPRHEINSSSSRYVPQSQSTQDRNRRPYTSGPSGPRNSPPEKEVVRPGSSHGRPPSALHHRAMPMHLPNQPWQGQGLNPSGLRPPPQYNGPPGPPQRMPSGGPYVPHYVNSPNASPIMTQGAYFPQRQSGPGVPPPGQGPPPGMSHHKPSRPRSNHGSRQSSDKAERDKKSSSRNIKKGIGIGAAAAGLMELLSGLDGI